MLIIKRKAIPFTEWSVISSAVIFVCEQVLILRVKPWLRKLAISKRLVVYFGVGRPWNSLNRQLWFGIAFLRGSSASCYYRDHFCCYKITEMHQGRAIAGQSKKPAELVFDWCMTMILTALARPIKRNNWKFKSRLQSQRFIKTR